MNGNINRQKTILRIVKRFARGMDSIDFKEKSQIFDLLKKCDIAYEKIMRYGQKYSFEKAKPYEMMETIQQIMQEFYKNYDVASKEQKKAYVKQLMAKRKICLSTTSIELRRLEYLNKPKSKKDIERELHEDLDQFICNFDNEEIKNIGILLEECNTFEKRIRRLKSIRWSKNLQDISNLKYYLGVIVENQNEIKQIKTLIAHGKATEAKELKKKILEIKMKSEKASSTIEGIYKNYIKRRKRKSILCYEKAKQLNPKKKNKKMDLDLKKEKVVTEKTRKPAKVLSETTESVKIPTITTIKTSKTTKHINNLAVCQHFGVGQLIQIHDESKFKNYQLIKKANQYEIVATTLQKGNSIKTVMNYEEVMKYVQSGYKIIRYGVPAVVFFDVKNTDTPVKQMRLV